jgi:hypothetical protein
MKDKNRKEGKIAVGRKGVTIKEAKEIAPIASEVYEFKPYNMYLFVAKPQRIIGGDGVNPQTLMKLKDMLNSNGIRGAFVVCDFNDLKVYELKPEDVKG